MKKRAGLIALILIIGLFAVPLVSAAGFFNTAWGGGWASDFLDIVFGTHNIATFQQFLIFLAIFAIIFVASSDILSTFTTFSPLTSWVIGFALAIIVAASGGLATATIAIFGLVAAFGALAIAAIIVSGFFVAFAVHWGISGLGEWIQKRNIMMKAGKGEALTVAGVKAMKDIGKEIVK